MKSAPLNSDLEVVYQPSRSPVDPKSTEEAVVQRIRLLWGNRRFVVKVTFWALVLATLTAFLLPKYYESTTHLMPPDDQSNSALAMAAALGGRMPGGLGMMASDLLGLKSSGALYIGILTSRTVQDDIVNKFELKKLYGSTTQENARKKLSANTSIGEDHKSGIITITITDRDPQRAAAIGEEYVLELNRVVNQLSTSSARRERIFLENRLSQVKKDLETAEKEFGDFSSKNAAVDIKEQAKAMVEAAASLQGELIAAQSQLEGLRQIYAEDHIRVKSLKARVGELHSQLAKLGGKYENSTDRVNEEDNSLYPSIRKLPVLGIAYADLYRRTKVQEAVFEILTQQYELAKVAEAKEIPNVKELDPPNVPERRSFPPRLLIMIVGVLAGFAIAVTYSVGSAQWAEVDDQRPTKLLVRDVASGVSSLLSDSRGDTVGFYFRVLRNKLNRRSRGDLTSSHR